MLVQLFTKYAANASKFSVAASSQANESFNNIVANKAPKNKCLSRSETCDFRKERLRRHLKNGAKG